MVKQAVFSLKDYTFDLFEFNLENKEGTEIGVNFEPSGVLNGQQMFLTLVFCAFSSSKEQKPFLKVRCKTNYVFDNEISLEDIPSFFYANSIAIIFPYIRAFISTLTLQANITPILIPTWNLTSLGETLKENTTEVKNNK